MQQRLDRCRQAMAERGLEVFLISDIENTRYLTGFTGSSGQCLVTPDRAVFVTDGRYRNQAPNEVKDCEIRIEQQSGNAELLGLIREAGRPVGFESQHVTVAQLDGWKESTGARFEPVAGLVEGLRMVKDPSELALIREAVEVVDATFEYILGVIRPGMTERAVAMELDFHMRKLGADREGFATIAASGPNSALPHAHPTSRKIVVGDFVKLDFGAYLNGYNSDITRTVVVGQPNDQQKRIYDSVLKAQLRALDAIRPGLTGKQIDMVARESITQDGFGECFTHNLGHSLGRSVHDGPGFGRLVEQELVPGMVLTVEPGIYIEGFGGVRIEDDISVNNAGCDILTKSPKQLICL